MNLFLEQESVLLTEKENCTVLQFYLNKDNKCIFSCSLFKVEKEQLFKTHSKNPRIGTSGCEQIGACLVCT